MHLYVYSDESGVLDKLHNSVYVFGGVIFLSKDDNDNYTRKYIGAENNIRKSEAIPVSTEIKACHIKPASKNKLYHLLEKTERFCAIISQDKLNDKLFLNKKTKQRYLDWVYKMAVKSKLLAMIRNGTIDPNSVFEMSFFVDEHLTATNGLYELHESLEAEFKNGIFNYSTNTFFEPLFPNLKSVNLKYCNSASTVLVRAADIIANHVFHFATLDQDKLKTEDKLQIYFHP